MKKTNKSHEQEKKSFWQEFLLKSVQWDCYFPSSCKQIDNESDRKSFIDSIKKKKRIYLSFGKVNLI